ncbi:MAG TPA: hypothetical protein VHV51_09695 [Polyangiaceae bacterium]|jgi:hypothetical protein|nr:hypothetical protein [Polyangiaceae bacterium]
MNKFLFVCSVALLAIGCNKDKAPDATAASAAPAAPSAAPAATDTAAASASAAATDTAAAAAPTASVAPAVVAKLPAEEDFETAASTAITATNASTQLTAIEKEIGKK